jgi:hypothetical protein
MAQESTLEDAVNARPRRSESPREPELPLAEIEAAIRSIRYGVVQILIQDGVVVQIDRTDKRRLK